MLNLEEIALRIEHPETCSAQDIDDLRGLTISYPYVQVFPLLYLKALANSNDIRFEEELVKYAFRISDRNQLYELVQKATLTKREAETQQPFIDVFETNQQLDLANEINETHQKAQEEIAEKIVETDKNDGILGIQEDSTIEDLELDMDADLEGFSIPLNIKENFSDLTHAAAKSDIETIEPDPESENIEEGNESDAGDIVFEQFEKEMIATVIGSTYQLEDLTEEELDKLERSTDVYEPEDPAQGASEERSFTSWLLLNKSATHKESDDEKTRIEDLVNRFVENPSSIRSTNNKEPEKPKKEFFSATKKAKESLETERIPVSETLAQIFALQGNYPKAIFTYEQLILINPEKKSFFASQIKELKKKLNT